MTKRRPWKDTRCVICGWRKELHFGKELRCGVIDEGDRFTPPKVKTETSHDE